MKEFSKGTLTVVTGCMFSGKTEELIRILRRLMIATRGGPNKVMLFKPEIDDRYSVSDVVSHSRMSLEATPIPCFNADQILRCVTSDTQYVGIDEAQFFGPEIVKVCDLLVNLGVTVYVAGLKQDFKGEVFGSMGELLVRANFIISLTAVCDICGQAATNTQRLIDGKPAPWDSPQVQVGGLESYGARCNSHHEVPGRH